MNIYLPLNARVVFLKMLLCLLFIDLNAQEVQKKTPQTKFSRPALTNIVLSNSEAESLVREMKKVQPEARFDVH